MRAALPIALALWLLAGFGLQELDPPLEVPRPIDGDERVHVGDLQALDCARCHAEVAAEWADTLHAFAWNDSFYQEELEGRRKPQSCHGCHIPQPVHVTGLDSKPVPRDSDLHLGVSCEACHRGPEGEILGPRGTPTDAHPSRAAETFIGAGTDALCSSCHATFIGPVLGLARDFAGSAAAAAGASCVGCHMAPVERSFATTPGSDGAPDQVAPLRRGRSHSLQTPRDPAFLARAFSLAAAREGQQTVLTLSNQAGHRVPGLIGRELTFEVTLLDAAGGELERQELVIDASAPLTSEAPLRVTFAQPGASVRIHALHSDPRLLHPVPFLERTLAVADD